MGLVELVEENVWGWDDAELKNKFWKEFLYKDIKCDDIEAFKAVYWVK